MRQRPHKDPAAYLPLSEQGFHILLALADAERHGYGIMQEIHERTGGILRLGAGTLYGLLKRLLASGLIEETDERPDPSLDDERRRYYRLTAYGATVLSLETRRLEGLLRQARRKRDEIEAGARRFKPRNA
jgi:DNA-binding PadR family transcriptional regulator